MKLLILFTLIISGCTSKEVINKCVKTCSDSNHVYIDVVEDYKCICDLKKDPSELGSRQPEE